MVAMDEYSNHHILDYISILGLVFEVVFNVEGCKSCEFIWFLYSGHVTYQIW